MSGGANLDTRQPLRLNVGFLLNETIGYSRDFVFKSPLLTLEADLEAHDFQSSIRLTRTGEGIFGQGDLTAKIHLECVRCLSAYDQYLTASLDELFVYPPSKSTEEFLTIQEDGYLDLNPIVREVLLLGIPIQPLCKEDCQGFCQICGANANETQCDHPDLNIDPRLEVLKTFKTES